MSSHTDAQLVEFSDRLLHDLQVFFRVGRALARSRLGLGRRLEWEAETAMVESYALHARGLTDFFYRRKGRYESDAVAAHFFEPGEWTDLVPPQGPWLRQVSYRPSKQDPGEHVDRFGEEIAHLNYNAPSISAVAKGWPIMQVADDVGDAAWMFNTAVSESRVSIAFKARLTSQIPVTSRLPGQLTVKTIWTRAATIEVLV